MHKTRILYIEVKILSIKQINILKKGYYMLHNINHIIISSGAEKVFFGAANTGDGFMNGLECILKPYKKRILIKGGPGTGKSSAMKRFYRMAKERGYTAEKLLCSSDPDSLDGVLIDELSLAIVDATAPHTLEPAVPGVTDSVLDPGKFWNADTLSENAELLCTLSQSKKCAYSLAYNMLKSASCIRSAILALSEDICDKEKVGSLARGICAKALPDKQSNTKLRFRSAISAKGYVAVDTFERFDTDHIVIRDKFNTSNLLMSEIVRILDRRECSYIRSPDPLDPSLTDALRIPSAHLTITVNSAVRGAKIISTQRYTSTEKHTLIRPDVRTLAKEFDFVTEHAFHYLDKAAKYHAQIEKIYISAMDFDAMEKDMIPLFEKALC